MTDVYEPIPVQDPIPQDAPAITAPPGGSLFVTPGGYHIALRNPAVLRVRDRKTIMATVDSDRPGESYMDMLNGVLAALIVSWDLRDIDDNGQPQGPVLPLPSQDIMVLENAPISEISGLDEVAQDGLKIIMPNFTRDAGNEASPTPPSAG